MFNNFEYAIFYIEPPSPGRVRVVWRAATYGYLELQPSLMTSTVGYNDVVVQ